MPSVTVDVCRVYTHDEEIGLLQAVHEALIEAFHIAPAHRNLALQVHAPHRLLGKTDSPDPTRTTNVSIFCLPGRSLAAKRLLYRSIVRRFEAFGIPGACVLIRLHELPPENFGVRGGLPITDIELGYSTSV